MDLAVPWTLVNRGREFASTDGTDYLRIVDDHQVDGRARGIPFAGSYTFQNKKLRVVIQILGFSAPIYYEVHGKDLVGPRGVLHAVTSDVGFAKSEKVPPGSAVKITCPPGSHCIIKNQTAVCRDIPTLQAFVQAQSVNDEEGVSELVRQDRVYWLDIGDRVLLLENDGTWVKLRILSEFRRNYTGYTLADSVVVDRSETVGALEQGQYEPAPEPPEDMNSKNSSTDDRTQCQKLNTEIVALYKLGRLEEAEPKYRRLLNHLSKLNDSKSYDQAEKNYQLLLAAISKRKDYQRPKTPMAAPMPRVAPLPMSMPSLMPMPTAAAPRSYMPSGGLPSLAPAALRPGAMSATPLPSARPSGGGLPQGLPNFAAPVSIASGGGVPGFAPSPRSSSGGGGGGGSHSSDTSPSGAQGTSRGGNSSNSDPDMKEYMEDVQRRIKKVWSRAKAVSGVSPFAFHPKMTVLFKIHTQGEVSDIQIDHASGVPSVDQAALTAVRDAAPFRPLPNGSPKAIDIEFSFDLRSSY